MDSRLRQHSDPVPDDGQAPARPDAGRRSADSLVARYLVLLACALAVLALDQLIKALVVRSLQDGRFIDLLGGLVRLDFTRNSGAAFGMFQSRGVMFAAVAVLVSLGILVFFRRVANSSVLVRLALGLILGGALGNLADRIRLGYVVDYVDLRWWYVFNLADSAIVVGVGLLLLHSTLEANDTPG
jgi:signal peptidase II